MHGSRWLTRHGAIRVGPTGLWECLCGKRYTSRQGFRRHLHLSLDTPSTDCYCTRMQAIPTKGKTMFQQRHYVAVAKVLADGGHDAKVASDLADMFAADNPNFKRGLFMQAAGAASAPASARRAGHVHTHTVRDGKPVCVYCGEEMEI